MISTGLQKLLGGEDLVSYLEKSEQHLDRLQKNMEVLNNKLQDPTETEFVVVTLPTRLAVDETKRLLKQLREARIGKFNYLVVNQMPWPPVGPEALELLEATVQRLSTTEDQADSTSSTNKANTSSKSKSTDASNNIDGAANDARIAALHQLRLECFRQKKMYLQANEYVGELKNEYFEQVKIHNDESSESDIDAESLESLRKAAEMRIIEIPLFAQNIVGIEGLEHYASALTTNEHPTWNYFS